MPTWSAYLTFRDDLKKLSPQQRASLRRAVDKLVADLRAGRLRKGLRVKKVQGHEDIWEMTWAGDGRATFEYGEPVAEGEPHVIWRRVGTHEVLDRP